MSYEIKFGYKTGETLYYNVYAPNGALRGDVDQTLAETGGVGSGFYSDTPSDELFSGDIVIVNDGVNNVGVGEYQPETVAVEVLGVRIINGFFDDDVSLGEPILGWETSGQWTVSDGVASGQELLIGTSYIKQEIKGLVSGRRYQLYYTLEADLEGCVAVVNQQSIIAEDDVTSSGDYVFNFTFNSAYDSYLTFTNAESISLSQIYIQEVTENNPINIYGIGE